MSEASTSQTLEAVDIVRLLALLPHRYPFLLVDRIVESGGDRSAGGIKNAPFKDPQFRGLSRGRRVRPGVMIIEARAQPAGAFCMHPQSASAKPQLFYFMTIDECKFRKPVT